jgi:putative heme-binding domain-containing protein
MSAYSCLLPRAKNLHHQEHAIGRVNVKPIWTASLTLSLLGILLLSVRLTSSAELPLQRQPWTTSRLHGSPDPPPPYRIERAFPRLQFRNPLLLARAPGIHRFFVAEQAGRIYSFPIHADVERADLFLDLTREIHSWSPNANVKGVAAVYGLAFHPRFQENRYCYICYVLDSKDGKALADGTRVSRFRVTSLDPPRCDPKSEKVILTWLAGGHNGGDLHFGPDGYLYISTGDGTDPNPPDRLDTGQDISDLLGSILRINVDEPSGDKPYSIPPDNPFLHTPGARPEIWAYGFRNPWRMSFDRRTGDLWVGDVGWERWEMIYRVKKGGNYGWSVMEGPQPVRPESRRGPTPILPPQLALPHSEAASITGGYVYRGQRLPELAGHYICGDWVTGRIWACRFDGDRLLSYREIARGPYRIVAFGEDPEGELYFVHYGEPGTIHYLVRNPQPDTSAQFPRKLSHTGLFSSLKPLRPASGVYPFDINARMWLDTAASQYWLALPNDSQAIIYDHPILPTGAFFRSQLFFPKDGVLVKHITLPVLDDTGRSVPRAIETQIFHYDGTDWRAYTYMWNDSQTDADLVPAEGLEREYKITCPPLFPEPIRLRWRYASRSECLTCHNPWADFALAFNLLQLNRPWPENRDYNQLDAFQQLGLLRLVRADKKPGPPRIPEPLVPVHDERFALDKRARSYLHVNCAHCHRFGAGGTADLDLQAGTALSAMKILNVPPVQGTFHIPRARILAPGEAWRSVLIYRLAKAGPGHMPHLGPVLADRDGILLVSRWINSLPPNSEATKSAPNADIPPPVDVATLNPAASDPSAVVASIFTSADKALAAYLYWLEHLPAPNLRAELLKQAQKHNDPVIRELFESWIPPEQRIPRLGQAIRPEQILALAGNAERGRRLFFEHPGLQCAQCHRVAGRGGDFGPDLSSIGKKYSRRQILESILEPSKFIDPQYAAYTLETRAGQIYVGLLVSRTDSEVVLRVSSEQRVRIPVAEVERFAASPKSMMPELLLRDLTPQQAADLLEFLATLQGQQ